MFGTRFEFNVQLNEICIRNEYSELSSKSTKLKQQK